MFNDLREFLDKVEELGDLKLVEGADAESDIGGLTELFLTDPNPPLLLFDNIKGYEPGYRVISHVFSTGKRIALGFGLPVEAKGIDLVRALREKIKMGIGSVPPVQVETGPVKQNIMTGKDVDLFKFPAPKWHELDGGRYIGTGSTTIMRDPDDGWLNVAPYRVQIQDKNTATIHIAPSHHGDIIRKKYWEKGLSCPAAVTCGQDPTLGLASVWPAPWGVCEYNLAGGLRGKPVEVTRGVTTDLLVPATAEIVLEGELVPPEVETRMEGPFGEWSGYYARGQMPEPAFRVKSVLYRDNPIIQGNPPFRYAFASFGAQIRKAAVLWNELDRQIPGVKGVWVVEQATSAGILVISLKQEYAGHAKQAAFIAAGATISGRYFPITIVVDDDIDPSNTSDVLWALGTRVEPDTSIDIISGCLSSFLQPTTSPEQRSRGDSSASKMIILACKPYHWIKQFPPSISLSEGAAKKLREKWCELFPSD
ncbi:UbiD family decarboxylase [Chloroflexota bacterium]